MQNQFIEMLNWIYEQQGFHPFENMKIEIINPYLVTFFYLLECYVCVG